MSRYGARIALLGGIIDYAGTFPPAALPLERALERAATFRREARHPWLMNRVALPLADIKKLTPEILYEAGADGSPWLFTALGSPVESRDDVERVIEWDLREIRRCNERRSESALRQWIVGYEMKLPPAVLPDPVEETMAEVIRPALDRLAERSGKLITPYFELGWEEKAKKRITGFAEGLVKWLDGSAGEAPAPGLKFRTGGKEKPTAEQLAFAVSTCTRMGLRFKATQGLHHPVSQGGEFGFVNLFAALAFAQALGEARFPEAQVRKLLEETRPEAFRFTAEGFRWGELELSREMIEEARRVHAGCFGSCSLDEPDQFIAEVFP